MSVMTVAGVFLLLVFLFTVGFIAGGTYETYRLGGVKDLQRDVATALREYDELLSIAFTVSAPPQNERGTLRAVPVGRAQRSPLTLIDGDAS